MQIQANPQKADASYQLALTTPQVSDDADQKAGDFQVFGEDGLSFFDFLDVINPLQHLPLIGPLYREFTGDELAAAPRVAGGALFFGPIGLISSAIDVIAEQLTGKDVAENVLTVLKDPPNESQSGQNPTRGTSTETAMPETAMIETPAETLSVSTTAPWVAGTDTGDKLDPVTAWAMAELNFRQAEAHKKGLPTPAYSYSHLLAGKPAPEIASIASGAVKPPAEIPTKTPMNETRRAAAAYRAAADTAPGTIAKDGGWFAQTMLDALAKSRPQNIPQSNSSPMGRAVN